MSPQGGSAALYRPDIDGLRAIAILLVLFFHGGFGVVSGGFVGVDIFFVISGFLITGIILREADTGGFSFAEFYSRRIRRICPALFLTLFVSAIAGAILLVPQDLQMLGRSISSAVYFYANVHFFNQVGYFDGPASEKPLLHTWSLAVEEQFYLIWPLLFLLLYRLLSRKALRHVILAFLCLSLVASELILQTSPSAAFYLLPYRAWELLLGASLTLFYPQAPSKPVATLCGVLGLAAIIYAAVAFTPATPFPGVHALVPCAGAALLIVAGVRTNLISSRVLGAAPLRFIGKISYSLYLFHWPAFSFTRMALDRDITQVEGLTIIAGSIGAATLSWRFLESPARRATIRFPALAAMTTMGILAFWGCGSLFNLTHGLPFRVPDSVIQADAARETDKKGASAECRTDPVLGALGCGIGLPPHDSQYDFVIWGDSHARHLALAFSGQAAKRGLAGVILWAPLPCGPFLHDPRLPQNCVRANDHIEQWIKTQTNLKVAFVAGYWTVHANGLLSVPEDGDSEPGRNEKNEATGISGTLRLLKSRAIQTIIIEDVPIFSRNVGLCAARARMFSHPDEHCYTLAKGEFEQNQGKASSLLHQISQRFGIPLLNTAQAFCAGETCRVEKNGVIFYQDAHHLNAAGSRYLGSVLPIPWPGTEQRGAQLSGASTTF